MLEISNTSIIIGKRFCGPPDSANGGYACGVLAGLIDGPAEVTLRRPPPLGRPLHSERLKDGVVVLRDGEAVVAEARPTEVEVDVPEAVGYAEAEEASKAYSLFEDHVFPRCFVCGPARAAGDGLCIFPGPVSGRAVVAAPWVPDASVCDGEGMVLREVVWAALDCPGGIGAVDFVKEPALLGRLAATLLRPLRCGERYVAMGWALGGERRKAYAGAALFSEEGGLCAIGRSTWVKLARA